RTIVQDQDPIGDLPPPAIAQASHGRQVPACHVRDGRAALHARIIFAVVPALHNPRVAERAGRGLFLPMPSANNLGPDGGVLGPNGGKPKGKTGQASDNSSEKGKPNQKTKAVAKLVPGPDNQPILVLDGDRPDREELRTVCDYFGMQP